MKDQKFGKLTLLEDFTRDGIRFGKVECTCGTRKTVPMYRLQAGQAKSCGKRSCRYNGVPESATRGAKRPYGPRSVTWATLDRILKDHAKDKLTLKEISEKYAVSVPLITYYARRTRALGGLEAYRALVESTHTKENS